MLLSLKAKLWAIGGAIIASLLLVVKLLLTQNSKLRKRAEAVESQLKFNKRQAKLDAEVEQEFSHRAEEARRDLDNDEIPEHLRNR